MLIKRQNAKARASRLTAAMPEARFHHDSSSPAATLDRRSFLRPVRPRRRRVGGRLGAWAPAISAWPRRHRPQPAPPVAP